jgi:hypothetical protein
VTTAADIIRVARTQVGTHESPAGSNEVKYATWYGLPRNPWCAMFVSWVFDQAGHPLEIQSKKGYCYCPSAVDYFKRHGMFHTTGPFQPGDIIFFDWEGAGIADHTGIVVHDDGVTIKTIEGNTSVTSQQNGGAVMERDRSHGSTVLGVGRVALDRPHPQETYTDGFHHPILKSGMTDNHDGFATREVSHLQHLLYKHHQNISVDGVFGPRTEAAVKRFQDHQLLKQDGQVGPITWRWLHR